jgi:Flp pilus assembly protein TadD
LGWLLASLATRTLVRNLIWHDPVLLWSEAVYYAPDIWVPYRGLGDALRERGNWPGAIEAYRMAAQLKPDEAETYLPLGTCLLLAGHYADAENAFAKAASLSPGLMEAETGRGVAERMLGRTAEARDRLLGVIREHPAAILPRQHLAEIYERDFGDHVSALRVCREIEALAPQTEGVAECIRRNEAGTANSAQRPNGR